jgi:hypothetical protein
MWKDVTSHSFHCCSAALWLVCVVSSLVLQTESQFSPLVYFEFTYDIVAYLLKAELWS